MVASLLNTYSDIHQEEQHALKRGAHIYASFSGYGTTSDAYHITSPPPNGEGARRSMAQALQSAGKKPSEIDYLNAHATSTQLGDKAEATALRELINEESLSWRSESIAVSSTKGAVGHLLGAAGAVEAIFTVLAIENVRFAFQRLSRSCCTDIHHRASYLRLLTFTRPILNSLASTSSRTRRNIKRCSWR